MSATAQECLGEKQLALAEELRKQMTIEYGELIGGPALYKSLGFERADTFRKAKAQGRLSVQTFRIPGRRGDFAITRHVAYWISRLPFERQDESKGEAPSDDQL